MPYERQTGFGLVELMVAMAISLLLLGGVVAIFSSSRSTYETTERMSRLQENGRFALDALMRDIRSAGYNGCARGSNLVSSTLNQATALPWNFTGGAVRGYEATSSGSWSPGLDATYMSNVEPNSDVLVIRVPVPDRGPVRLATSMVSGSDPLDVVDGEISNLQVGDIALAASCEAQAFFQITGLAGGAVQHAAGAASPGNAVDNLSFAFRADAISQTEVVPVHTIIYYLRDPNNTGSPSLWRRIGNNAPEELVEGVDRMQLEFGVDTNNDLRVDTYFEANSVTDWNQVLSVSVALLVRSPEEYGNLKDTVQYTLLNEQPVGAFNDRRMRRVFTSTATLRNKVPV